MDDRRNTRSNKTKRTLATKNGEHKESRYYKEQYKVTRNLSLALMRKQKNKCYSTRILKAKGNSKEIWNIINSVLKSQKRRVLPDIGVLDCSEAAFAEKFNDFFR